MNHSEYPSVTARTAKESLFRCGRGGVAAAAGWLTQPFWPCRIESPTGMNLEPSAEANEGKNRSSCLWGIHFSPPALGLNPSLSDSTKTCDFLPPPLSRSIIQHHHATTDTKTLTTFPPPPPTNKSTRSSTQHNAQITIMAVRAQFENSNEYVSPLALLSCCCCCCCPLPHLLEARRWQRRLAAPRSMTNRSPCDDVHRLRRC